MLKVQEEVAETIDAAGNHINASSAIGRNTVIAFGLLKVFNVFVLTSAIDYLVLLKPKLIHMHLRFTCQRFVHDPIRAFEF